MARLRLAVFTTFAVLLLLSFVVTRGEAQPNTLKQIVPGVWFREGDIQHEGHCNNVIIEMSDHLVVVDANFPSGARRVIEDARKVSSKPIKFVFDTHHHGDHAYGNPVWTKMGAVTIAYQGVADEMKRYEPARWRDTSKTRADVRELNLSEPEPPQKAFTESPYVMQDAMRRVELHFFGWAHTRGDGFAYLPTDKVLCTGDAIVNGPYNYTADGNIGNWPSVVHKAQKLDVEHVLPGHGPAGGKEVMAGQAQFFTELRQAVEKAVKSGKKLDDLVTMKDGKPAGTSIELSAAVKTWVGNSLPAQVRDAFNEATQHKPSGDLPH
jgi:glyoxylase-like metal-dependent hydrolase (beta-lactamase superfamily II)